MTRTMRWMAVAWLVLSACEQDLKLADPDETPLGADTDPVDTDPVDEVALPQLEVDPPAVDFGYLPEGDSTERTVRLTNIGTEQLDISDIQLSGSSAYITDSTGLAVALAPGDSTMVTVTFTAESAPTSGLMTVISNDGASPAEVPLDGLGSDPAVTAEVIDFGIVPVDQEAFHYWRLDNPGNYEVVVSSIASSEAAFSVAPFINDLVIPAGGYAEVEVVFLPTEAVVYSGELTIGSDARVPPMPVAVTGEGADAPTAVCSADPTSPRTLVDAVTLVGHDSTDPAGRPLTAAWAMVATPTGSSVTLSNADQLDAGPFMPDQPGAYVATLMVTNDLGLSSEPCVVTVTASTDMPVAVCTADPMNPVAGVDEVAFYGSSSYDPGGGPLTASWTFTPPAGSGETLPAPGELDPGGVIPDELGDYTATLVVTNDVGQSSAPCTVTVTASAEPPVAVCAGGPQVVGTGTGSITLDGLGSYDPAGRAIQGRWSFLSQPAGSNITPPPGFEAGPFAANLAGDYVAQLDVVNDLGLSDSCLFTVTASDSQPVAVCSISPPTVDAGLGIFFALGDSSYDPAGRAITDGQWRLINRPVASSFILPAGTTLNRGPFTADAGGTYIFELVVTNDLGIPSAPCRTTLTANEVKPVAVCSANPQDVVTGADTFTLRGNQSYDPIGHALITYDWAFLQVPGGSGVTMPGGNAPNRGPILADRSGGYFASLTVTNALGVSSDPCTVFVTASASDAPVAVCSTNPPVLDAIRDTFRFIGNQSFDPGGRSLTGYQWTLISKPTSSSVNMPGGNTANRGPLRPDIVGDYVGELVVTNDLGISSAPCRTSASAEADSNLWVELTWQYPEDIDLHLLRGNGSRNTAQDCYYANCAGRGLSWGQPGPDDNPTLDLDDILGTGPENINIPEPEARRYTVVVHDYSWTRDRTGLNNFTVKVYIDGILRLIQSGSVRGEGQWVDVAEIDLTGPSVVVTPL